MNRDQKAEQVAALHALFSDVSLVVLTHYAGLSVAELSVLRGRMRDAGAGFRVAKNRLTRRAVDGTPYACLADLLIGPTGLAFSVDPVAAARVSVEFARTNKKLVIVGGALGQRQLDEDEVRALATMPSLDQLRGKLIGVINAPASKLASVVQAPAAQLARIMTARSEQTEAA